MKTITPLGVRMHTALALSMEEMQPYRPRPSVPITSCLRKLVYHRLGFEPKPPSGRMGLAFDDGHFTEAQTLEMLKLIQGVEILETQIPVNLPFCPEPGHADFLISDDGRTFLLEHKNYSMYKFDALEAGKY